MEQLLLHRELLRATLLEALTPLAEAMQRQDSQRQWQERQQTERLLLLEDLLKEVLSSLQPPASQQIQEMLDRKPQSSSPRSES